MSRCRAKAPRGRARQPPPAASRATTRSSPAAPRRRRRRPPRRPRRKLRRTAITGRASGRSRGSHRSRAVCSLEASVGNYASRYLGNTMPGSPAFDFIQVTEQCAAGCAANGNRAGLVYRGGTFAQGSAWQGSNNWRASLSYVEGKHSMKFGYQGGYLMQDSFPYTNSQFMTFRVNNGSAESDQRDHRLQRGPAARPIRRVLRAGSVDDGPDHAAGRPAVRSRVQHLPGGHDRRRSLPADGHCRSRKPRASMRTRT